MPARTETEAGCQARVGKTTNPLLQDKDEVLLLLPNGTFILPGVAPGLHRHLRAQPLLRHRLAEANIDCPRIVTVHLFINTAHRKETMVSIVYAISNEKGMMRGIETTILTNDKTMMTTDGGMIDIILLGMTEDII